MCSEVPLRETATGAWARALETGSEEFKSRCNLLRQSAPTQLGQVLGCGSGLAILPLLGLNVTLSRRSGNAAEGAY